MGKESVVCLGHSEGSWRRGARSSFFPGADTVPPACPASAGSTVEAEMQTVIFQTELKAVVDPRALSLGGSREGATEEGGFRDPVGVGRIQFCAEWGAPCKGSVH